MSVDDGHLWLLDRIHAAEPISPFELDLAAGTFDRGLLAAARRCGMPLADVLSRRHQGYLYTALVWSDEPPAADFVDTALATLRAVVDELPRRWDGEWLPEIEEHLAFWEGFDPAAADDAELAAHLAASIERLRRVFEIHFLVTIAATVAVSGFEDLYGKLLAERLPWSAFDLLKGFDNWSLRRDAALRRLADLALRSPRTREVFERSQGRELAARCREEADAAFLDELDRFLAVFGATNDRPRLVAPTWSETPEVPLDVVRSLLMWQGDDSRREAEDERERAVADARRALSDLPRPVREEAELLLDRAQRGNVLLEDHAYWIDQRCLAAVRRVLLAAGARLAGRGLVERADDVFLLTPAELAAALAGEPAVPLAEVGARGAEMDAHRRSEPPRWLGRPSRRPPPHPALAALGKVAGHPAMPAAPGAEAIRGVGASPGRATGVARRIDSVADAARLRPGDVLVAVATLPSWTPLFPIASAVVTDEGGVLCHSACVAREYGLPAVVGTGSATAAIEDGRRVEVDGSRGVVRLLGAREEPC